jgi:Ser/Thr protein kinase RdoA (MazF antagonist)
MLRPIVEVLEAYGLFALTIDELGTGLINQTWKVGTDDDQILVIQCVNPVFPAAINTDISKLTRHLKQKGQCTAELIPNLAGSYVTEYAGDNWRLMTYVPGVSYDGLANAAQAFEAGAALARFHVAVADLEMNLSHQRPHVHDTLYHIQKLCDALEAHTAHPRFVSIAPLAETILSSAAALPAIDLDQTRLVHGDPKISNLLFDANGKALCWIDLDTLAHMPLCLEMGDAFRSWCNPESEDSLAPEFSLEYFSAAAAGYASESHGFVAAAEWRAFVDGTQIILVELAARFCADALNENYFGWNPDKFATRGEHNEARARNQLKVLASFLDKHAECVAALEAAFTA